MIQNDDRESAIWWSWWRMAPSGRHSFAYFMPEQKISFCRERRDRTWFLMTQKEKTNIINATRGRSPLNFWMDHTSQATGAFTWQCSRLNDPPRDRIKEQLEKPMLFVLPFAQLNHFFSSSACVGCHQETTCSLFRCCRNSRRRVWEARLNRFDEIHDMRAVSDRLPPVGVPFDSTWKFG